MINAIGKSARKAWQYVSELFIAPPQGISEALRFDDSLLYLAMGWLARGGKRE